jgi:hypothetical protein
MIHRLSYSCQLPDRMTNFDNFVIQYMAIFGSGSKLHKILHQTCVVQCSTRCVGSDDKSSSKSSTITSSHFFLCNFSHFLSVRPDNFYSGSRYINHKSHLKYKMVSSYVSYLTMHSWNQEKIRTLLFTKL